VIVGLDVGFSETRPSSGAARLRSDGSLRLGHTRAGWQERRRILGDEPVRVAAIDAPYTRADAAARRACERVLSLGGFQRRCKPASSHVPGTGRLLRQAGWESAQQLKALAPASALAADFPRVDGCNVIEAFPNAYLGVCLPLSAYAGGARLGRGRKFDWLYDGWRARRLFGRVVEQIGLPVLQSVTAACERNAQHDQRAALVCLLTAAGVLAGRYTAVGDTLGGWIFLPPWPAWAGWAREELERARRRQPGLDVWIDGRRHSASDALLAPTRRPRGRPAARLDPRARAASSRRAAARCAAAPPPARR
jgi:hypothetical protein